MGSTLEPGIKAPINASTLRLLKNFTGKKLSGGSQFIHIPNWKKKSTLSKKVPVKALVNFLIPSILWAPTKRTSFF